MTQTGTEMPCNPYARLDVTDRAELPACRVEQRLELLVADLADGSRITLAPSRSGGVVLRVADRHGRVAVELPPEAALRVGAHAAALAAHALEPEEATG